MADDNICSSDDHFVINDLDSNHSIDVDSDGSVADAHVIDIVVDCHFALPVGSPDAGSGRSCSTLALTDWCWTVLIIFV